MANVVDFKQASKRMRAEKVLPSAVDTQARVRDIRVGIWLMFVAFMVFCMVIVGGATRLTDSGLSITEWKPIHGVIPPLNADEWAKEFELYRAIPEYQLQNKGMSLAQFQFIYWWEWAHRLLGRVIGLVFVVPLIVFAATGHIRKGMGKWLWAMFALGGLQGAIGWWMVASGLSGERLDVAAYRLATHLSMAFILMSLLAWTALDHLKPRQVGQGDAKLVPWAIGFLALVCVQIVMGAFVAGTDAGLINTDWPSFGGSWGVPESYGALQPFARNLVENTTTIQFNHRIGAYLVALAAFVLWLRTRASQDQRVRASANLVAVLVGAQVALGVATLVGFGHWAPPKIEGVLLGIAHQGLGAILFAATVLFLRTTLVAPAAPIRPPERELMARMRKTA